MTTDTAVSGTRSELTVPVADARRARRRLVRLLADRRGSVAVVLVLVAAGTAATVATPAFIGVVIDAVAGDGDRGAIDRAAIAVAMLAVVGAALQGLGAFRAAVVGESALRELRTEVFDHAIELPIDVVERAGTGEFVSRLTGDVEVLARAVRQTVPQVVIAASELALVAVALALVDWRLAVVASLAGTPAAAIGGRWYARHAPPRYRDERARHAELTGGLLQGYDGRRTLVAARAVIRYRWAMAGLGRRVIDAELSTTSARNRLRPSVSASLAFALVAVVVVGWSLVADGLATVGTVSAAALYVIRVFSPIGVLLEEIDELQQASAAVARLVGVTDLPRRQGRGGGSPVAAASIRRRGGAVVELRGVRFGYEPDVAVLDGIDLHIADGERIVVVGPSGAGKTTLAELVAGMQRPWSGDVLVDGRRVDELDAASLASLVVLVTQESHVFARTVADNVRMARPGLPDSDVRAALDRVDALAWVERLPQGLDTIVGAGHHRLTPPQAQQLALARLLCADPAVVVLDEATADLDATTAARTERHLAAALGGRTVLTVAHRLDAVRRADRVLVMEAGAVVASGRHDDLLAAGGTYADLWAHWVHDRGDPTASTIESPRIPADE